MELRKFNTCISKSGMLERHIEGIMKHICRRGRMLIACVGEK